MNGMGHQLIAGVHTDIYTLIHAQGQFTYWHVFRGGRKPENPGETKMNTEIWSSGLNWKSSNVNAQCVV